MAGLARVLIGCLAVPALCLTATLTAALGEEKFGSDSYITPFPKDDVYRVRLVGDSLASGLRYVLPATLGKHPQVRFNESPKKLNRLSYNTFDQKLADLKSELIGENVDIAIMLVGTWDRRNMRDPDWKRLRMGSPEWRSDYARRVGETMKTFKAAGIATYWVGLPPVRRSDANADVQLINEVFRERAYLNGVKYVDSYDGFTGDNGGYSAYGPDLTGKIKLLRERDGIHLTYAGYQKLGHYIERVVRRDLDLAKRERSVPLDGDTDEQAAIRARIAQAKRKEERSVVDWLVGGAEDAKAQADANQTGGFFGAGRAGEQPRDDSKIKLTTIDPTGRKKSAVVDIVRPAIPASIVALITRKQREDKLAAMGDTLVDRIPAGVNIMSSVTPASQALAQGGRISPAQTPFFRVLVKGERMSPRPGRADDISWPRPEPPPRQRLTRSQSPAVQGTGRNRGFDFGETTSEGGVPLPGVNPFRPRV